MWISQATDGWSPDHIAGWFTVAECALSCVKFSCLPLRSLRHWCLFFTIHGSRQANGNQVTWTSCNQKEVLKPGATGRVCRLNSSQPAQQKFFFFLSLSLSLSQRCDSSVVVHAVEVGRNCYHKNLARTHPSHPRLVLISQPSREETTQHTRPSCPIIGLSLQQPSQNTHTFT